MCAKAAALYNYQLKNKENAELRLKTNNQKVSIVILIISLCFLIIIIFMYRKYYKIKLGLEKKKMMKLREEQYRQSQAYINENKEKIKTLAIALDKACTEKDKLAAKLMLAQKTAFEKCNEKILADIALQRESMLALKKTMVYKKFSELTKKDMLREDDWKALYKQVMGINSNFLDRLRELSLNDLDFKMSLLIKLGITPSQISLAINRSKQWVTNARKTLAQRLFDNIHAKPVDWDNFIRDL